MASHTLAPFPDELLAAKKQIRERARSYGLDFFPVIYEMCDYEQMNQIAAYGGFPQRYPHWRFGMEYERLRKQHHYGLGRIYEMVINNDPCYAYLQESNALVDQKLVIAHVYGHSDFFKNNLWFSQTKDRKSTRLNSSHLVISYAVFCLKKKNNEREVKKIRPLVDRINALEHQFEAMSDDDLRARNRQFGARVAEAAEWEEQRPIYDYVT